jgi:hypothetical protein
VPPSRSDRRLLIVTALALVLAGVLVAVALVVATDNDAAPTSNRRMVYVGPADDLRANINLGSPLYFANPFGESGFWLDKENGEIVALKLTVPGTADCSVKWKGAPQSYVDCNGDLVDSRDLDRYEVIRLRSGTRKGGIVVNLREIEPAPGL